MVSYVFLFTLSHLLIVAVVTWNVGEVSLLDNSNITSKRCRELDVEDEHTVLPAAKKRQYAHLRRTFESTAAPPSEFTRALIGKWSAISLENDMSCLAGFIDATSVAFSSMLGTLGSQNFSLSELYFATEVSQSVAQVAAFQAAVCSILFVGKLQW